MGGAPFAIFHRKDCNSLKIIIVGNGKVGFSLAQQLVREEHEVTIVDQREDSLRRAMDALDAVGITAKAMSRPSQLSGGQQQRVAIARAIATASPIIMADEPTGALDSKTGQQVLDILRGLNRLGTTVILITHDNGIAAKARRMVRLQDGRVLEDRPNVPDEDRALNANM